MRSKSLKERFHLHDAPLDVCVVDLPILLSNRIKLTGPEWLRNILELVIFDPSGVLPESGVIKSILRPPRRVHIEQHANLVFKASIKHPLNLLGCSIHAADIFVVLIDRPIPNRKPHPFHASLRKLFDMVFCVPGVPMRFHPFVGVVRIAHFLPSLFHHFTVTV